MWVEFRGGPRDGQVMEVPNDLHSVRFPMLDDSVAQMWAGGLGEVSRIPQMSWVEYGPMEQFSPFWGVWSYGS
jgi:hypothetical protein